MKKRVSILGCGWLGLPLAKFLVQNDYTVKGSTTSVNKLETLLEAGVSPYLISVDETIDGNLDGFLNAEILLIDVPFGKQKAFLNTYKKLAKHIASSSIENVIFISSTSVYADINTEITDTIDFEINPAKQTLVDLENIFKNQPNFGCTIIRFSGLIGGTRNPGNFFKSDRVIANGLAPVNLIHLEDCIQIIEQIITQEEWNVTLNASADTHPSKQSYYTQAAKNIGRTPVTFEEELNSFKIIDNTALKSLLNYQFTYADLIDGLDIFKSK